jgi:hypothetical protein
MLPRKAMPGRRIRPFSSLDESAAPFTQFECRIFLIPRREGRRTVAMRRQQPTRGRSIRLKTRTVPTPTSAAVIALNRMGFGPRLGDIAAFNALGSTGSQRMAL